MAFHAMFSVHCISGCLATTRQPRKPYNPRTGLSCAFLLLFFVLAVNSMPQEYSPSQRNIRLCSKSLSDALYLICFERGGYNEPFGYSGESDGRIASGPGLVDECCHRPCSFEQLEQYCKPANGNGDNSQDGIEESVQIVTLSYPSLRKRNKNNIFDSSK